MADYWLNSGKYFTIMPSFHYTGFLNYAYIFLFLYLPGYFTLMQEYNELKSMWAKYNSTLDEVAQTNRNVLKKMISQKSEKRLGDYEDTSYT